MIETNSVIVVEGISDKALLSRFFKTEIVTTNGTYVSRGTISYLKALEKTHDIVIITDPDRPGKTISDRLVSTLKAPTVIKIDKQKSIKNGKVGVAETDANYLLNLLKPIVSPAKLLPNEITLTNLIEFTKIDPDFRKTLALHFPLQNTNNKTMIKRLKYLGVTSEEIERILHG